MTNVELWLQNNDDYLASALAWLRLRLIQLAQPQKPGELAIISVARESLKEVEVAALRPVFQFPFRRAPLSTQSSGPAQSAGRTHSQAVDESDANQKDRITADQVAEAAAKLTAAEAVSPPPALIQLARTLGLSRFEQEILLLCAAMELDTRFPALCAAAQNEPNRPYPTFALALSLFDDPAWEALSAERPLRYWRLVEINQPGALPLTLSPLRADERITNYIKGLNLVDDRLAPFLVSLKPGIAGAETIDLPPSQQKLADRVVQTWRAASGSGIWPVMQLTGADSPSKQLVAWHAARDLGLGVYHLPVNMVPAQPGELENFARLWQRELFLAPLALYLAASETGRSGESDNSNLDGENPGAIERFLARVAGPIFLAAREPWPSLRQSSMILDISRPTSIEQQGEWEKLLGDQAGEIPAQLAGQFNLNLPSIHSIQSQLESPDSGTGGLAGGLWRACLQHTRPQMETLAQRLEPIATWDDIVLPPLELALLHQISAQVNQRSIVYDEWGFRQKMTRGLGINALFAGESGTGKTMAAEVIANELRLNLYRIDLSAVVSKYIGETEKNLRRVFDAAEDGGALLFFDEADALFGKRSEVKDSHDRYANIETNYLLQRMEAYSGLAILATNFESALDSAFVRRLRFIVKFRFPGPEERRQIWLRVFPPEVPLETGDPEQRVDFDWLARINLTGGSIHNIAINAAFMAAIADPPKITMPLILESARQELRKMQRPINEADFRYTARDGKKS